MARPVCPFPIRPGQTRKGATGGPEWQSRTLVGWLFWLWCYRRWDQTIHKATSNGRRSTPAFGHFTYGGPGRQPRHWSVIPSQSTRSCWYREWSHGRVGCRFRLATHESEFTARAAASQARNKYYEEIDCTMVVRRVVFSCYSRLYGNILRRLMSRSELIEQT